MALSAQIESPSSEMSLAAASTHISLSTGRDQDQEERASESAASARASRVRARVLRRHCVCQQPARMGLGRGRRPMQRTARNGHTRGGAWGTPRAQSYTQLTSFQIIWRMQSDCIRIQAAFPVDEKSSSHNVTQSASKSRCRERLTSSWKRSANDEPDAGALGVIALALALDCLMHSGGHRGFSMGSNLLAGCTRGSVCTAMDCLPRGEALPLKTSKL